MSLKLRQKKKIQLHSLPVLTPCNWQLLCLRRLMFIIIHVRSVILALQIAWCELAPCARCVIPTQHGGCKCLLEIDGKRKTPYVKRETFKERNWCLEFITKHSFLPSLLFGVSPADGTPGDLGACLRLQNRLVCQSAEKTQGCCRLTNKSGTLL